MSRHLLGASPTTASYLTVTPNLSFNKWGSWVSEKLSICAYEKGSVLNKGGGGGIYQGVLSYFRRRGNGVREDKDFLLFFTRQLGGRLLHGARLWQFPLAVSPRSQSGWSGWQPFGIFQETRTPHPSTRSCVRANRLRGPPEGHTLSLLSFLSQWSAMSLVLVTKASLLPPTEW